jgi:protein-S-isoprenylcysteine O-methyltransferase Ste14
MNTMYQHQLLSRSVPVDLNNHEQRNWMAAYAIPIQVVTSVLLWIRIATRFSSHGHLGLDDILIVFAWVLGTVVTGLVLYCEFWQAHRGTLTHIALQQRTSSESIVTSGMCHRNSGGEQLWLGG